ncbi:hypothetical protein J31TS4_26240 [Paenibacillus sp. J31TS4]|uniref:hypothetical protein n=1 Tax=Paenibacillus sp. J31TS4 TaxID=2807195 RepID=UPI001B15DD33|nr:hypothetical protein [Paenibacillus sp. J31TS4]GIP39344.1 hypothetical protein J31TS4_26240 [Paenibacillus sp. J31TS4]
MDTNVVTKRLSPNYLLTVNHESDDNSFVGRVMELHEDSHPEGSDAGETIFVSFPMETPEQAVEAAEAYFRQLRLPSEQGGSSL